MTEYEDRKCRTCEHGDKTEYEKPCIIYSDNCEHYKPIEIITRKQMKGDNHERKINLQ